MSLNKSLKKDETYAIIPCWMSDGSAKPTGDYTLRISKGALTPAVAPSVREVQGRRTVVH